MRLTSLRFLLLICLGALGFRLALLPLVKFPGIADPNHYYNVGVRLVEGHGFTIDYIWQYNDDYAAVEHPEDYWMPLTSLLAGASMKLFGVGVHAALIPFMLVGAALPALAYAASRQFGNGQESSLFAAAAAAAMPEYVLNSLRTDTTIPNTLLVVASILLLIAGLRRGGWLVFAASGAAAGLAYLTRSENGLLLVVLLAAVIAYGLAKPPIRWRALVVVPLVAVLIALPWALRTLAINGTLSTPTTSNMFFLTDYRDHYLYNRHLTLQGYLASQTVGQMISKRLFEMAASLKLLVTTLDIFLPVAVIGGALLVLGEREQRRERLLTLAPGLLMLAGMFLFYGLLAPFKSQGGSFKKADLSLIPLLLPLAALALERALPDARLRRGAMAIAVGLLAFKAVDLVRLDAIANDTYLTSVERAAAVLRTLPDGDDAVLMTQDPFIFSYVGVPSVVFPFEDRDTVYAVAQRYGVDYLLMPSYRPSLEPLETGDETDPRFVPAADVPGTNFRFFAVKDDAP